MGRQGREEGDVSDMATGTDLTPGERALAGCYATIEQVLREQRGELDPFAERNAIKALAALWQVVNGLGLEPGQLYDVGA
jgi:hypothetical protein